jgi:hypothetical protein
MQDHDSFLKEHFFLLISNKYLVSFDSYGISSIIGGASVVGAEAR